MTAHSAMEKASPGEVLATFQRLGHPRQELIVLRQRVAPRRS